jgi:hypothetical protein
VIDARDADLLKEIVRRESRSLLQYVGDSFPWTTRQERETLPMLRSMIEEEREAAAALARFLASQRQTPPYLGAFPQSFTTINFISLDYLLPKLVDSEREDIALLEHSETVATDSDARAHIERILNIKRQHLETLQKLSDQPVTSAH